MANEVILPDVVALVGNLFREHPLITDFSNVKIGTRSPDEEVEYWIRISRIGGEPIVIQRLDRAFIQVDCFSLIGDPEAMDLARAAHAVLFAALGYSDTDGIITAVEPMQGLQSLPDTSKTPPTPRVTFTSIVSARPV